MPNLIDMLQLYGVLIVFALVLVEQIGLPIPAFPILIVAGALAAGGEISWPMCLAVSIGACLISDVFWFNAGRFYGKRILRLLCKISLSPDYCVSQTEDRFKRFGPKSLMVAKFIPGFNIIASPMSGALGVSTPRFLAFSMTGSLLWSGTGIAIGAIFHSSVDKVLAMLEDMGGTALMVLLTLLALFVLYKYIERRRFRQGMQIERISMSELVQLIRGGEQPIIVDARSVTAQQLEQAVPGALIYNARAPDSFMALLDKERHIVVYCSCPNDVTAAQVAKLLISKGYHRARPLHGGLDAWNAHHSGASDPQTAHVG
ncbi:DedA family protein/thiosulfate sulfurtransferase GlpE [Massilia antarctica]|uniref:DedA family protein/thiosulfate sulfurtransferase GlpE n=1 Tax=Massilia antarctica TaxID=2765360 RepID=A0AA48WI04_9BURK|nr:DedA family protein/thiosulfate sulfurtransferase GlpE [Massilia antarctica]QPI52643.1 DedA family protein/thiosulfate sulfurtransferase GlpE [Massilia antarctica]